MAKKTQNLVDFEGICERVVWSLKLTPEQMVAHIREHRMDAFHFISNPKNGGMLIIGQDGTDRFWAIARRHLAEHPAKRRRTSLTAFVEQLRAQFSQLFLVEGAKTDQVSVDSWISTAYDATARHHEPATHYIPCGLLFSNEVKRFTIGPVAFYHKTEFFRLFGGELEKLRETVRDHHRKHVEDAIREGFPAKSAATSEQSAQLGNRLTDGLFESFKRYNWFAVIDVSDAHREASYNRALFATRGALNIIKVLLGSYYTHRLRTADEYGPAGKAAALTRDAKGELTISLSNTPMDNTVGDQWLEILTSDKYFPLLANVLTLCSSFEDPPPLCARLMDALAWFGDAIAERSSAAKIVKFVNAIERVCGTGREFDSAGKARGVTDIVLTRSSIFYSVITEKSFSDAKREIAEIYQCRSDLVHGSVSPFDDKIASQVARTDRVTNVVLLAAIDYYKTLGLEDRALDKNGLRAEFLKLEVWNNAGRPNPAPSSK
jgi:hypothetical protein